MNIPVAAFASGVSGTASFTLSIVPSTVQHPQGATATYQQNLVATSVNGFSGTVTFTVQNNLCSGGTATTLVSSVAVTPDSAGLTVLNETIPTSCAVGSFTVVVSGVSGAETETATLTMTVVSSIGNQCSGDPECDKLVPGNICCLGLCQSPPCNQPPKGCQNNSDCGSGNICCSGSCYSRGPCTADTDCTDTYGACSKCISTGAPGACASKHCTICKGPPVNVTISCPSSVTVCNTAQTALTSMSVTNPGAGSVPVTMSVTNSQPCACCGPAVMSPSSFTLAGGATQSVTISVPVTCASTQCYQYLVFVTAGQQVANCAFQVCITNSSCFVLEIACNNAAAACISTPNSWGSSISDGPGNWTDACALANLGFCEGSLRLRSLNNFAGTVTISYTDPACQASANGLPISRTLTAGQTDQFVPNPASLCSTCQGKAGPFPNPFIFICNSSCTVTATSGSITSSVTYVAVQNGRSGC